MNRILSYAAAAAALLVGAPAYAQSFSATIDCSGVYAPGDDVPFDVTIEDLNGKQETVFVSITLDVPGGYNNQLVASAVVKLHANEVRTFDSVEHLPPSAPPGSYSMFMNASSEHGTDITICDFEVE